MGVWVGVGSRMTESGHDLPFIVCVVQRLSFAVFVCGEGREGFGGARGTDKSSTSAAFFHTWSTCSQSSGATALLSPYSGRVD